MKKTAASKKTASKTTPRRSARRVKREPATVSYHGPDKLGDYDAGRHEVLARVITGHVGSALFSYELSARYRAAGDLKRAGELHNEAVDSVTEVTEAFNMFGEVSDREREARAAE